VVLEMEEEDMLNGLSEECRSITLSYGRNEHPTHDKTQAG